MSESRGAELYERAKRTLPGGVSRNTVLRSPHPVYVDHAVGSRVIDIDGVEYIDFANNMASLIHGHANPAVIEAATAQLSRGTAFALATEIEIEYAEFLCSRNPGFERIRFVNSGTEAVMGAVKAARAATGRPKIAKVEGAYHGLYDFAEVSQTSSPANWGLEERPESVPVAHGTPAGVLSDVVVLPFNDADRSVAILDEHRDEIACVIVDPMPHRVGLTPADERFVQALREWTTNDGSLLVFDEVITFRTEYGGMQDRYSATPDITALGKIIGGGFPVGALAGRVDVMEVMNPLVAHLRFPHSGTFSANPVTMTAGLVAMQMYDEDAIHRLNTLATRAIEGIRDGIATTGADASVTGTGSMFRLHFKAEPPRNHREAFPSPAEVERRAAMLDHLFASGFLMINTCSAALATSMTDSDVDSLVAAITSGL
jgi:glutamate-1-semialdehyde 2,1-aminomutase